MQNYLNRWLCLLLGTLCLEVSTVSLIAQTTYVDLTNEEIANAADGSLNRPFPTLKRAAGAAIPNGTLSVKSGLYPEFCQLPITLHKPLIISAVGGAVRFGPPPGDQKMCTTRVMQLTGDPDGRPRANDTVPWGVLGVDLGANTEHDNKLYIFFGDVLQPNDREEGDGINPPFNADLIAYTANTNPDPVGFQLTPVLDSNHIFFPFTFLQDGVLHALGSDETPTGAFSYDGKAYVFIAQHERIPGTNCEHTVHTCTPAYSSLTYSTDPSVPASFIHHFTFSDLRTNDVAKFIQVAPWVVTNADIPGLPSNAGEGLVMFGHGDDFGHFDADGSILGVYLAWMPLRRGELPQPSEIRYFSGRVNGLNRWSSQETNAAVLFRTKWPWSSISVGRIQETGMWMLLYQRTWRDKDPDKPQAPEESIVLRVAPTPTDFAEINGPSGYPPLSSADEIPIFTPVQDGAYKNATREGFMHRAGWDDGLAHSDLQIPGFAYGAYLLNRYTRWDAANRIVTIHYLLSTGQPYQVHQMRSRIRLTH